MSAPTACVHRIRIEEPNGTPWVHGVCRLCGYERDYRVADEEVSAFDWLKNSPVGGAFTGRPAQLRVLGRGE